MPVVELDLGRLQRLVGAGRREITDALPYLGLDIEGRTGGTMRVEYSPNRPDYSTDYGIALGLQGLLGVAEGMVNPDVRKGSGYKVRADRTVSGIRPSVTGIVARNGSMDGAALRQLIAMQEDLHLGIGRRRRRSSIGIHDMDGMTFPLTYTTVRRDHRFTPLHEDAERSVDEVLRSDIGAQYGHILGGSARVPAVLDSAGRTVSLPPIINAAATAVTARTTNLFVEVTGAGRDDVEDALSVIAVILHAAGFELHAVGISGAWNATPQFRTRRMQLDTRVIRDTLGLELSADQAASALRRSRLDATASGRRVTCIVPRYRFDVFGPMDLVEETELGYGIGRMQPVLSPPRTLGEGHAVPAGAASVSEVMIGLGYTEAVNSSLTSEAVLYRNMGRDASGSVSVIDSKSGEHTVLRDMLLPGLVGTLAANIHEPYPQRLFEIGTVFVDANPIREEIHVCAASSHRDASYSEIKAVLECAAGVMYGAGCKTRTAIHDGLEPGHAADIILDGRILGSIGEISGDARERFRLREPVAAFEARLNI